MTISWRETRIKLEWNVMAWNTEKSIFKSKLSIYSFLILDEEEISSRSISEVTSWLYGESKRGASLYEKNKRKLYHRNQVN